MNKKAREDKGGRYRFEEGKKTNTFVEKSMGAEEGANYAIC